MNVAEYIIFDLCSFGFKCSEPLLVDIMKMWSKDKEKTTEFIKRSKTVLSCLNDCYKYLAGTKEIEVIESLLEEEKKELWRQSAEIGDKKYRLYYCRGIYTVNQIYQN